jgi:hypothetical protein
MLAVSTHYAKTVSEADEPQTAGYPPPAQILGQLANAIFLDVIDEDAIRLERSNAMLGMTPTKYRAGGTDLEIRFAIGQCSLGAILVAATQRGVCAILTAASARAGRRTPIFSLDVRSGTAEADCPGRRDADAPRGNRRAAESDGLRDLAREIDAFERTPIRDGATLGRFHDLLLFVCAYPPSREILKRAESILKRFKERVDALEDVDPLLDPEVSGIAGTTVDSIFSYDFARWLHDRYAKQLEIDWDDPPDGDRLATAIAPHIPAMTEESNVDANVPFLDYLRAAGALGRDNGLAWLLERLDQPMYDSVGFWIRWKLANSPVTRTHLRRRPKKIFFRRCRCFHPRRLDRE